MDNNGNSMCFIGCIVAGILSAAGAWFLLSEFVGTLPLILIALFVFINVAWTFNQAFCGEDEVVERAGAVGDNYPKTGGKDRDFWDTNQTNTGISADTADTQPLGFVSPATTSEAVGAETKPAAKKKAAPKKAAAAKPASKSTAAKKSASKTSSKSVSKKSTGPERLKKPKGTADDLKLISGVGPKLEKTLNGLGFWHFEQIAKWKKADVAIVDDELKFKGRIERDDWIKQAKALAKGGEAEYIKVFGKKPK